MCQRKETVRSRGRSTRLAWPLTVANCASVHTTCKPLMQNLPRAVKRLRNVSDGDSHEHPRSLISTIVVQYLHKAIYFSWLGPELFCLLLGPPEFNCWFSFAPVSQWCCLTPQGSPGVGRNRFLSSPHLCFIIVFICDLFVSRDDPLMS